MLSYYQWIGLSEQNMEGVWSWLDQNVNMYLSQSRFNNRHTDETTKLSVPTYLISLYNVLYNSTNL